MLNTIFAEIAPIITKTAPTIATMLGSPLAGVAVSLLGGAFGTDTKKPSEIVTKVLADVENASGIFADLEGKHSDMLNYLMKMKMPSNVEVNIKMQWNNQS